MQSTQESQADKYTGPQPQDVQTVVQTVPSLPMQSPHPPAQPIPTQAQPQPQALPVQQPGVNEEEPTKEEPNPLEGLEHAPDEVKRKEVSRAVAHAITKGILKGLHRRAVMQSQHSERPTAPVAREDASHFHEEA